MKISPTLKNITEQSDEYILTSFSVSLCDLETFSSMEKYSYNVSWKKVIAKRLKPKQIIFFIWKTNGIKIVYIFVKIL